MYKIYLAAKFARQDEMKKVREILSEAGFEVTSRWLDEITMDAKTVTPGDFKAELNEHVALVDLVDIRRADAFLTFTEPNGSQNKGGGRHWEMGYAYAMGKRIIAIGEKEIVFHYMQDIEFYENITTVINELNKS